jgi:ketosteroid isomerase-like protein
MAQSNADVVLEMIDVFNRAGATAAAESGLAADCVWHAAPQWPGKPVYEGRAGAVELIEEWTAPFEHYRWDLDHLQELGDRVLTLVHHRGTAEGTPVEAAVGAVWRLEDGAVVEAWFYFSWVEALAAAGVDRAVTL